VRTFTEGGAKEFELSPSQRKSIELSQSTLDPKYRFPIPNVAYEPQRTPSSPTGLRGRMAVFEVMEMSQKMESIVLENPVDTKIFAAAREQGMLTMQEDAMLKAFDKKVPWEEVNTLSTLLLADEAGATAEPAAEPVAEAEAAPAAEAPEADTK